MKHLFLFIFLFSACSNDSGPKDTIRMEDHHDVRTNFGPDLKENKAPFAFDLTLNTFIDLPINCELQGKDPDDDELTFRLVTQPQHGKLTGEIPKLKYRPDAGFLGAEKFTFQTSDGVLDSKIAEVVINVSKPNTKPVLTIISPTLDAQSGSSLPAKLHATAIDAEDGDISAKIKWESNLDGELGAGGEIEAKLQIGKHFIRAEIIDEAGTVVSQTVNLIIIQTFPTKVIGTPGNETGAGIGIDKDGNVYVAGTTDNALQGINLGSTDVFLIKYDKNGVELWKTQFGGSAKDTLSDIHVDQDGNTFMTGSTEGSFEGAIIRGASDAFVIKIDTTGKKLWSKQFGSSDPDFANAVEVASNGDFYVAGSTEGSLESGIFIPDQESDAFVKKFNKDGGLIWTRQLQKIGKQAYHDLSLGMLKNGDTHLFLLGNSNRQSIKSPNNIVFDDQFLTAEYLEDGSFVEARYVGNGEGEYGVALAPIHVDSFVSGVLMSFNSTNFEGWTLGGYDSYLRNLPNYRFKRHWGGRGEDISRDVCSGDDGRVYVVGHTNNHFRKDGKDAQMHIGAKDIFIQSFGMVLGDVEPWVHILGNIDDNIGEKIVAKNGFVYLLATTTNGFEDQIAIGGKDLVVIQFDKKGTRF